MSTPSPELTRHVQQCENLEVATVPGDADRHIAYAEYGAPNGAPLVFLHGTPGSRRLGKLFDTAAQDHGIRLLALDRPGYGCSSPWPDRTVRDAGTFVTAVLDDVGEQTAGLAAFSGGSAHALATAMTHSDRIGRVDIISGATPPCVREDTPAVQQLFSGLANRTPTVLGGLFRGQAWLAERLDPSFVVAQYTTNGVEVPLQEGVAKLIKEDFIEAFAHSRSGAVTEFQNTSVPWNLTFDDINANVWFWHGENDTNVPITGVRKLATQIPMAQLEVLDNTDHLRTLLRSIPRVVEAHR